MISKICAVARSIPGTRKCLLLSFLIIVAAAFCWSNQLAAYNGEAACRYAQKYKYTVCSDGYFFEKTYPPTYLGSGTSVPYAYGYDCAHFVSCCIGSEPHEQGGGLSLPPPRTQAYGEPGAASLVAWLIRERHGTRVNSVAQLGKGDVIAYDRNGNGSIDHVALYLGNNEVVMHSESWTGAWHLVYCFEYRFAFRYLS